MRLEYLFDKIAYFLNKKSHLELFTVVQTLIEVINLLERNDISTDVIKELDRYQLALGKLSDAPAVDNEALAITLQTIEMQLNEMQTNFGKHTKQLRNDELLNLIRQKMATSTNLCSFDIPALYYWIHQNSENQQHQLHEWLEELAIMKKSVKLIMQLIRNSAIFVYHTASCGFYQTGFKHNANYQIVRIKLPNNVTVFPEISGNKHRITVRFLNFSAECGRPQQTTEDITFELSCCYI